jgi:hypothetical protein
VRFRALVTRGAGRMRTLKLTCLVLCVLSSVAMVRDGLALRSPVVNGTTVEHGILGIAVSLALAVFWACALYGVQHRVPVVWTLGWVVIVGGYVALVIQASSSIVTRLPGGIDRWIPLIAVVMGGGAITVYWCLWWHRQRSYFEPRTSLDVVP